MTSKCIILVKVLKSYNALALYFPFTKLGSLLGKYFIVLFIFAVINFAPALLYSIFLGSGESVALGELHCVEWLPRRVPIHQIPVGYIGSYEITKPHHLIVRCPFSW